MGSSESKQSKAAIQADGQNNVKKAAFLHSSQKHLDKFSKTLKKKWQDKLEERLQKKEDLIKKKQDEIQDLLEAREKELKSKDSDAIEKLEKNNKKSFKELTGYTESKQKLQNQKDKTRKVWKEEEAKIKKDIDNQIEIVKGRLQKQTPSLPALSKLGQQRKHKTLKHYADDDNLQRQRDQEHARAERIVEEELNFQKIYTERFEKKASDVEIVNIVDDFHNNLKSSTSVVPGCGLC